MSTAFNPWLESLVALAATQPPDQYIGGRDNPYLLRWIFAEPQGLPHPRPGIYVHKILRDDDDRALHDHPWDATLCIVKGSYREIRADCPEGEVFAAGSVRRIVAETAHRLEVVDGHVWTVCLTGPRRREWGFVCPQGWVHWADFVDPSDPGTIGPGCGGAL